VFIATLNDNDYQFDQVWSDVMFWAMIATTFGCVLLFSAGKYKSPTLATAQAEHYIKQWELPHLWKVMGGISILLSLVLWSTLYGLWQGVAGLMLCAVVNYLVLYVIKPSVLRLLTASVVLIGCCFIYTTVGMVIPITLN